MATLILGTVGRVFGGPLGGIIGAAAGSALDRSLFGGGGRSREAGRSGNIAVQSAAYGEPVPVVSGRMRAAGNLIWTSGIKESAGAGGKQGGGSFSYSASFAVGLAAGRIESIGRIWADGRMIRDATGLFLVPTIMRLYPGSEVQAADPLILAAEGSGGAPAYRGIAYAVFEDLPLADFGNRIPNLSFEIDADGGAAVNAGTAMARLAAIDGRSLVAFGGDYPEVHGTYSGQSGSIAQALAPLLELSGAAVTSVDGLVVTGRNETSVLVAQDQLQARLPGAGQSRDRLTRFGGDAVVDTVELAYYDVDRDFQPGLQRARRAATGGTDHQSASCALSAEQAKQLAMSRLARNLAARARISVRLPWRHIGLRPGTKVVVADEEGIWRVRDTRFEAFVVHLELERIAMGSAVAAAADGGRPLTFDQYPAGPTSLHLIDLPLLPGEPADAVGLWVAAAGASPGWRRAAIEVSSDGGESYAVGGIVEGGAVMGTAANVLPPGTVDGWDRFGTIEVDLLSEQMWLESRPEASVLGGANLALLGDELFQFATAEALAPGRFRLSGLLRGRRGSEGATAGHSIGERFVLLDPAALLALYPGIDSVGRSLLARATGIGDANSEPVEILVHGRNLQPLAPAHLRVVELNGDVVATWIRRSRTGFGWPDFVDAPLGEEYEAYLVEVSVGGEQVRSTTVAAPGFTYAQAERIADGGSGNVTIRVAQLSASVGLGAFSAATLFMA